ncbi:MAG: hypothetical protein PHV18_09630 [Lachnospiraceae bacterium]|nr:hypothetical protein [Lachnospiraceae bacterium]
MIKEYFTACEETFPGRQVELRRISLSLRRAGIVTMETLCRMQRENPENIKEIRNIGGKSAELIAVICRQYEDDSER